MAVRTYYFRFCVAALCLSAGGCAAPVVSSSGLFSRATVTAGSAEKSPDALSVEATPEATDHGIVPAEGVGAPTQEDLGQVLEDLEAIGTIDRHAQQRLLAELKRSPVEKWPKQVQQFRSALEHREQLREQLLEPPARTRDASLWVDEEAAAINSWRTATRRALVQNDDGVSETQPVNPALLSPADMADDDPLALLAELPPPRPQVPKKDVDEPNGAEKVARALFVTDAEDGRVEPAVWHGEDAQPLETAGRAAPIRLPADLNWEQHLSAAIRSLSVATEVDSDESDTSAQIRLRLLQLAAQDTDAAMAPLPNLSAAERGYWAKQLFALATYTDSGSHLEQEQRAALAAKHLEDAVYQLRELSSLRVQNLAFCERVYDFGAYEQCPTDRFTAGSQVTLYAEVENYHSRLTENGYHTSLASSYEVVNERGDFVAGGDFPKVEDNCRNRRRDFHIQYTLPVPSHAQPGNYRLKLTIVDNLSGKRGQNAIEFQIADSGSIQRP